MQEGPHAWRANPCHRGSSIPPNAGKRIATAAPNRRATLTPIAIPRAEAKWDRAAP
jgi:hypothetical protein